MICAQIFVVFGLLSSSFLSILQAELRLGFSFVATLAGRASVVCIVGILMLTQTSFLTVF